MLLDADICYRALKTRDRAFDGRFFVGVTSTRIYCRPICPARTPRRDRCLFFPHAASAEAAGFKPCLRCRPDLAPGNSSVDAVAAVAKRATRLMASHPGLGTEELAARLGVSSRHLRRALKSVLGLTPTQLRRRQRLREAKRLLRETNLPLARVALASGFRSLRRFNDEFRRAEGCAPSALRKAQR